MTMIFWGFTFVAFKLAYESFEPISIIFFRLLVANIFLFGFAFTFKKLNRIKRKDLKWFVLMAILEPCLYFLGEAFGLTLVSSTVGAVIISTIPLFVPYAAFLVFKERLTPMNIVGLVISFSGVLMVLLVNSGGMQASLKGILLMFVAVFSAVGYTLIAKKLTENYNPLSITAYQGLGIILFIPFFLIMDLPDLDFSAVSSVSIYSVLYLGLFGSGICFILLTFAMREIGAAKANIFGNLIPVVTAILSFYILKEPMPFLKVIGIAVVIVGLLMSQLGEMLNKRSLKKNALKHSTYA
jgi:drug/metabolite transporter (DMT)-like permease